MSDSGIDRSANPSGLTGKVDYKSKKLDAVATGEAIIPTPSMSGQMLLVKCVDAKNQSKQLGSSSFPTDVKGRIRVSDVQKTFSLREVFELNLEEKLEPDRDGFSKIGFSSVRQIIVCEGTGMT